MKRNYDFSKSVKNPYSKKLKKQITIRIDNEVIEYFKNLSKELSIPYQNLINLFLRNCAKESRRPSFKWD
jgi:uncharacterized protein (DUF4415 family)